MPSAHHSPEVQALIDGTSAVTRSKGAPSCSLSQPSSSHRKLFLLFFLVLLLVFPAVFYLLVSPSTPAPHKEPSPTPAPQLTLTPTPNLSSSPENWQNYSSVSFSIQYPSDINLITQGPQVVLSRFGPTQTTETELFDGVSLVIEIKDSAGSTPLEHAKTLVQEINDAGITEIIVSPSPYQLGSYQGITFTTLGLGEHQYIILASPDGTLIAEIINSTVDPGNLGFEQIVDQILSTFALVDQSDQALSLDKLQENDLIESPLTITGKVDNSWMFEGVFLVKLLDAQNQEIASAIAQETTPGSWMAPGMVNFTSTLTFSTSETSGVLLFQNDNPGDLPSNTKSAQIPVRFTN